MTLKELITQVSFENLLPYLKTLIVENERSLYAFREAYDRLRLMEPAPNFVGEIHVEWHQGILEEDDKWIGVSPMHDTSWEEDLAKEIVVEKDIQLSTEELAARCLWEITFYGFSPKEIETHFDRMFNHIKPQNKYDIALEKLEESIWKHEIPRKYRSRDQGLRLINGEYFTKHRFHFKEGNKTKRKRKYRQELRKAYLKKMSRRTEIMESLLGPNSSFVHSDIDFLWKAKQGLEYTYFSVTNEADKRLSYIRESMEKYQQLDLSAYDNAIVCIQVSSLYPLKEKDIESFKASIKSYLTYNDIRFGTITTDSDRPEVKVRVLLNKLTE